MSEADKRKWIIRYRNNPGVKLWLQEHPPRTMEHAYKSMPIWRISPLGMKMRHVRKRRKALTL